MRWVAAARTDQGRVRSHNEDNYLLRPGMGLFAVADGMGGHAAGEVASALAVERLERAVAEANDGDGDPLDLRRAVTAANRAILHAGEENPRQRGMGTTLTALGLGGGGAWRIGHVGDSRAYRLRDGTLDQLTVDHTWVQQQVDRGQLAPEQAWGHPLSSILTRALGTDEELPVDVVDGSADAGDTFLLCSDGLTQVLRDDDLRNILTDLEDVDAAVERLIAEANQRGGPDNITAIVILITA